ncbi:hypothetical protein M9H77_04461 [Catharanthus roseus]|uniref:Uncharacterized protein n=1 Tax=Catharanthus roseus TaxID=4058 RepID=A0ACC0CEQ0_CATRO|nr:hypothetical protein M9H77_04461 [Catharanthus roseus]
MELAEDESQCYECLDGRKEVSDRRGQMLSTSGLNYVSEPNLVDSGSTTGGKSPTAKGSVEEQTGEKGALKRITPIPVDKGQKIPVDKGQKNTLSKDRGKIAVGKNNATALDRRKGVSLHFV